MTENLDDCAFDAVEALAARGREILDRLIAWGQSRSLIAHDGEEEICSVWGVASAYS